MVHNGSTTGVEAAAGGVTVLSFQPHGEGEELFTNRVGQVAHDEEVLVARIRDGIAARDVPHASSDVLAVLGERFAALDGPLAVDRIVDVWEGLDAPARRRPNRVRRALLLSGLHHRVGSARARLRPGAASERARAIDVSGKFPPLERSATERLAEALRRTLSRFDNVVVDRVGPHLVHVHPRAGRR
jgi:hypothetical protein